MHPRLPAFTIIASLLFLSCPASADSGAATNEVNQQTGLSQEWRKWFGAGVALHRIADVPYPVFAVAATNGDISGWVFRTDHVPPVVNGKRGQIGVMVGLGRDGLIKGVLVLESHDDPPYFSRLKKGFYAQFHGKPASRQGVKVDTVATATISSRAVIEDVFLSSQTVMSLPGVNPLLRIAPVKPAP